VGPAPEVADRSPEGEADLPPVLPEPIPDDIEPGPGEQCNAEIL